MPPLRWQWWHASAGGIGKGSGAAVLLGTCAPGDRARRGARPSSPGAIERVAAKIERAGESVDRSRSTPACRRTEARAQVEARDLAALAKRVVPRTQRPGRDAEDQAAASRPGDLRRRPSASITPKKSSATAKSLCAN